MGSLNKVTLIGNLGKDPELSHTSAGKAMAKFSLATNERWRDKHTGEIIQRTEWHNVVVFNEGLAKVAGEYLHKGSQVYLEGKLQTRKWQDQAGQDRYTTEVVLNGYDAKLVMLGIAAAHRDSTDTPTAPAKPVSLAEELDDEIPF